MIILTQKSALVNDKIIAYVDVALSFEDKQYYLTVNKKQKARFNAYLRTLGFVVGVVDAHPVPLTKVI